MFDLGSGRRLAPTRGLIQTSIVILAILLGALSASATEKARVLNELKHHFGRPIDKELNLYDLSKTLAIQASFQEDRLTTLRMVLKEEFNDRYPNWKETNDFQTISYKKYQDCIRKFNRIKPIGALLFTPQVLMVTNNTAWRGEFFENVYIDAGLVGRQSRVRVLKVNYFQRLTGKILSKAERIPGVYEVKLDANDDDWAHRYYVKKDVFDLLIVDQVQTFEGAFIN